MMRLETHSDSRIARESNLATTCSPSIDSVGVVISRSSKGSSSPEHRVICAIFVVMFPSRRANLVQPPGRLMAQDTWKLNSPILLSCAQWLISIGRINSTLVFAITAESPELGATEFVLLDHLDLLVHLDTQTPVASFLLRTDFVSSYSEIMKPPSVHSSSVLLWQLSNSSNDGNIIRGLHSVSSVGEKIPFALAFRQSLVHTSIKDPEAHPNRMHSTTESVMFVVTGIIVLWWRMRYHTFEVTGTV